LTQLQRSVDDLSRSITCPLDMTNYWLQ